MHEKLTESLLESGGRVLRFDSRQWAFFRDTGSQI